ncbi:unnamed protein product [Mesocestoides corti]|uniref:Uncharacterized protein n=1 Tax=Mesocestoides corti TaxID=53468 RepID=A0A158QTC0_MESCO|nr:unnamed protein product [Mesocestoides corti]
MFTITRDKERAAGMHATSTTRGRDRTTHAPGPRSPTRTRARTFDSSVSRTQLRAPRKFRGTWIQGEGSGRRLGGHPPPMRYQNGGRMQRYVVHTGTVNHHTFISCRGTACMWTGTYHSGRAGQRPNARLWERIQPVRLWGPQDSAHEPHVHGTGALNTRRKKRSTLRLPRSKEEGAERRKERGKNDSLVREQTFNNGAAFAGFSRTQRGHMYYLYMGNYGEVTIC